MYVAIHQGEHVLGMKGLAAGQHLVEQATHRVEVCAPIDVVVAHLLRRHIGRRTEDLPRTRGPVGGIAQLGDAEVDHPQRIRIAGKLRRRLEQNVVGLQIAVNDALGVGLGQRLADLIGDVHRATPSHRLLSHARKQRAPAEVLHRDVEIAFVGAPVVEQRHRAPALQLADRLRLSEEALERDVGHRSRLRQELQRDQAVDRLLSGLEDDPHAALAQAVQYAESACDQLANGRPARIGRGRRHRARYTTATRSTRNRPMR